MTKLPHLPPLTFFYLNQIAPKICKKYIQKYLLAADESVSHPMQEIVTMLTSRYPLTHSWQQQEY